MPGNYQLVSLSVLAPLFIQQFPYLIDNLCVQPNCVAKVISVRNEKKVIQNSVIISMAYFSRTHMLCLAFIWNMMAVFVQLAISYVIIKIVHLCLLGCHSSSNSKVHNDLNHLYPNSKAIICVPFGCVLSSGNSLDHELHLILGLQVVFFAERDIYPGEEITYDYHFNHEDEGKKIPCFCNSKNCRRYLN